MTEESRHRARTRHTEIGVMVQLALTTLLGLAGFLVMDKLSGLQDALTELQKQSTEIRINVATDRFTATDWRRERAVITDSFDTARLERRDMRERISAIEERLGDKP